VCDAVYHRRDQAHAEYAAALDAAKLKAVGLCEEIERTTDASGPQSAAAKIPEWRAVFESLGEMPRAEARGLQDRFARAIAGLEAQLARERQLEAERSYENLFEAVRRIRAYEWAVLRGADNRETLKHAAEAYIADVRRWPKGTLHSVKDAFAKAGSGAGEDAVAAEKALRLLCVRAEILCDSPTPAEDEALRREYQVQRLAAVMGQGGHAGAGDRDALTLEWIRHGGVAPVTHDRLQTRFIACLARTPSARPPESDDRRVQRERAIAKTVTAR